MRHFWCINTHLQLFLLIIFAMCHLPGRSADIAMILVFMFVHSCMWPNMYGFFGWTCTLIGFSQSLTPETCNVLLTSKVKTVPGIPCVCLCYKKGNFVAADNIFYTVRSVSHRTRLLSDHRCSKEVLFLKKAATLHRI